MKRLRLLKKNAQKVPSVVNDAYERLVVTKIRARYTFNQELAILRQRDSKPEEFALYNAYVEECKTAAKKELRSIF